MVEPAVETEAEVAREPKRGRTLHRIGVDGAEAAAVAAPAPATRKRQCGLRREDEESPVAEENTDDADRDEAPAVAERTTRATWRSWTSIRLERTLVERLDRVALSSGTLTARVSAG